MIYERIELLYVTFENSLVFLRVPWDAPRTSIFVVARAADSASNQIVKSLTSQVCVSVSLRLRFWGEDKAAAAQENQVHMRFIVALPPALYKFKFRGFQD